MVVVVWMGTVYYYTIGEEARYFHTENVFRDGKRGCGGWAMWGGG